MKKLLGVSIAAMLAVTPMIASANGSAPTAATDAAATNEPFVGVALDQTAHIATTSYVQGAYNAAIGAVNTRLKTAASGNANIDQTVKTTIAAAVDDASDTALVTEKAIRTALNSVASDAVITEGAGIDVTSNKVSVDLTSNGGLKMSAAGDSGTLEISKGNGLTIDTTGDDAGKLRVAVTASKGLGFDSAAGTLEVVDGDGIKTGANGVEVDLVSTNATLKITGGQLEAKVGDGLQADSSGIAVKLSSNKGLQLDGTAKSLEIKDGDGIKTGSNGIEVDLKTDGGLSIDNGQIKLTNGVQVANAPSTYTGTGLTTKGYVDEAIATGLNGKATEAGVTATISQSTVPVYTTWNGSNTANVNVQSSYYRTDARTNGVNAAPANPS